MKVIIAGSRSITDYALVEEAIKLSCMEKEITEVISGGCKGADRMAERYAKLKDLPLRIVLPDWERFGKSAGFRRNAEMAKLADALILVWDGSSKGSANMLELAKKHNLRIYVYRTD